MPCPGRARYQPDRWPLRNLRVANHRLDQNLLPNLLTRGKERLRLTGLCGDPDRQRREGKIDFSGGGRSGGGVAEGDGGSARSAGNGSWGRDGVDDCRHGRDLLWLWRGRFGFRLCANGRGLLEGFVGIVYGVTTIGFGKVFDDGARIGEVLELCARRSRCARRMFWAR